MKKNILLITGDHVRHDAIGCNYNENQSSCLAKVVRTPNLDRIASEGISFRNSFSADPICVPARAAITTGRYPHKCTGYKNNTGYIRDDNTKIAQYFSDNGYETYAIGKLHYVPYSPPGQKPLLHGFQHAELCEEGRIIAQFEDKYGDRNLEDYHDFLYSQGWGGYERSHIIGNNDIHPGISPLPEDLHEEAWVANRTIHYLKEHLARHRDKPFFMWTSFTKPHPPYDPPWNYINKYDPREIPAPMAINNHEDILKNRDIQFQYYRKWYGWDKISPQAIQNIRRHYCALMSFQDSMIGKIVQQLDSEGILENTIIIYTADHGDMLGDFGRFFKSVMYDSSVKVPLIIRIPGLPKNLTGFRDQFAGSQDILPTLASLSELDIPENIDGIDLSTVIYNPNANIKDYYVSQCQDHPVQKYMFRTQQWKYIYCEIEGTEELYDVTTRDYELNNLAHDPKYSEIKKNLRNKLIRWCIENNDKMMLSENNTLRVSSESGLPKKEFRASIMGWRYY